MQTDSASKKRESRDQAVLGVLDSLRSEIETHIPAFSNSIPKKTVQERLSLPEEAADMSGSFNVSPQVQCVQRYMRLLKQTEKLQNELSTNIRTTVVRNGPKVETDWGMRVLVEALGDRVSNVSDNFAKRAELTLANNGPGAAIDNAMLEELFQISPNPNPAEIEFITRITGWPVQAIMQWYYSRFKREWGVAKALEKTRQGAAAAEASYANHLHARKQTHSPAKNPLSAP